MKRKIALIIAIVLEIMFVSILPYSLNDKMISITPSIFLVMFIISQRQYSLWDNLITCVIFTTIYSLLMNLPILETNLIYIVLVFISKIWSRSILDSVIELAILSISIVFVKEIAIQTIRYFVYNKKLNFIDVLSYRIAPTMIFMIVLIFVLIIIYQIVLDYYKVKQEMGKQHEEIKFFQYFNHLKMK